MKVNPILSYYSTEKYNQINQDYNNLVSVVNSESDDKNKSIFSINTRRETKDLSDYIHQNQLLAEELKQRTDVGDSVPTVGKIGTIVDKIKDNDYIPAAGLASLALLNGPEDIREAVSAYKQIKALCTGKQYEKPYDYKIAQHPFSFFRGTLLNDYVNPFSRKCKFPVLANKLLSWDKTLWDTEAGDWVKSKFKININKIQTTIDDTTSCPSFPLKVQAYKFNSPSKFGNLTARAMTRTPVLGLAFSGAIETAHLVKEIHEGHNPFAEIGKSTLRLASSAIITGYCGAIGSKFGPVGSIISMGIGTILNNKIEQLID